METPNGLDLSSQLVMKLNLDLRGSKFVVERDQLMNLPESILLCLFPNGLVLSRPPINNDLYEEEEEEDIYYVDVRSRVFSLYILYYHLTYYVVRSTLL